MPMDFKSAGSRVRSLIASKKPQELQTSALTRNKLRDNVIDEHIARSPRFQATANQRPEVEFERPLPDGTSVPDSFEWDQFGEFVRDVARAGYQYAEPEVMPRNMVRPSAMFNREAVSRIVNSEDFIASRPYTSENAPESLFGAIGAAATAVEMAPEIAEHLARSEQMREEEELIDDAEQMLEDLRERAKRQREQDGEIDPKLVEQIKDTTGVREAARGQLQQLLDSHQASGATKAAAKLAKAAAAAHGEAVATMRALSSLPGCEPGSPHNRTPEQTLALAEKLTKFKQLRELADQIGRKVTDMRFKRQAKSRNVAVEPVGIRTGREITRLLPHELARMQVPALRPLWLKDWSNHALLEWEMGGKEPAGAGPIVYVFDGSASMDADGRIIWASSTGGALLAHAQRTKRDFAAIQFGSPGQFKTWIFPGREVPEPDQVIDCITHFFRGGTSILTGMREAQRLILSSPKFKTADVIIATDGQDRFQPEDAQIVGAFKKMGVRIHGIAILAPDNRYLQQACEYVVDIEDLAGANDATDALAENIT